jgi:hypothetical protein
MLKQGGTMSTLSEIVEKDELNTIEDAAIHQAYAAREEHDMGALGDIGEGVAAAEAYNSAQGSMQRLNKKIKIKKLLQRIPII